jgi:hypothetical protein
MLVFRKTMVFEDDARSSSRTKNTLKKMISLTPDQPQALPIERKEYLPARRKEGFKQQPTDFNPARKAKK